MSNINELNISKLSTRFKAEKDNSPHDPYELNQLRLSLEKIGYKFLFLPSFFNVTCNKVVLK